MPALEARLQFSPFMQIDAVLRDFARTRAKNLAVISRVCAQHACVHTKFIEQFRSGKFNTHQSVHYVDLKYCHVIDLETSDSLKVV